MTEMMVAETIEKTLRAAFGDRLRKGASLAAFTSARIGGPAEFLLAARSASELAETAIRLWELEQPFRVLGGGSNVLIADSGMKGVVILNQARTVRFDEEEAPRIWCESGAALGALARRSVERGWAGLEWAGSVPGTVGGAVVGNAGAHGRDIASSLQVADILQQSRGVERWEPKRFGFGYRTSWLKQHPGEAVVLSASFHLTHSTSEETKRRLAEFTEYRKQTQPAGASWGSMFRNPPGDYAGRLIEMAGLKGYREGDVMISPKHGNFFINLGGATAGQAWQLIRKVREGVREQSGVALELEIELIGDWSGAQDFEDPAVGEAS